jgi:hypothetical protein
MSEWRSMNQRCAAISQASDIRKSGGKGFLHGRTYHGVSRLLHQVEVLLQSLHRLLVVGERRVGAKEVGVLLAKLVVAGSLRIAHVERLLLALAHRRHRRHRAPSARRVAALGPGREPLKGQQDGCPATAAATAAAREPGSNLRHVAMRTGEVCSHAAACSAADLSRSRAHNGRPPPPAPGGGAMKTYAQKQAEAKAKQMDEYSAPVGFAGAELTEDEKYVIENKGTEAAVRDGR